MCKEDEHRLFPGQQTIDGVRVVLPTPKTVFLELLGLSARVSVSVGVSVSLSVSVSVGVSMGVGVSE